MAFSSQKKATKKIDRETEVSSSRNNIKFNRRCPLVFAKDTNVNLNYTMAAKRPAKMIECINKRSE